MSDVETSRGFAKPETRFDEFVAGKRGVPVGARRPAGEELSSVEPLGGKRRQGLAPRNNVLYNTERVCKQGLLVVEATVKGFEEPWSILIDSEASGNNARRSTIVESQLYAEALKARKCDLITVRLATGTMVSTPKVEVDLGVKFLDFNSVERCLVLDLDTRYDLILGMAWLERHEPWIDWRSKTLGATRSAPGGALESHEPTSARKQKRFWREHRTETVNVLDIGVSEVVDTRGVILSGAHSEERSQCVLCDTVGRMPERQGCEPRDADISGLSSPVSEAHSDELSQSVSDTDDRMPGRQGCEPKDARDSARLYPTCGTHSNELPLSVSEGTEGIMPVHPGQGCECCGTDSTEWSTRQCFTGCC